MSGEEESKKPASNTGEDPFKDVRAGNTIEVGKLAAWSVSSCKPGMSFYV